MEIHCTPEFKAEFEGLLKKKSYYSIQAELIAYFFGRKKAEDLMSGTNLNNNLSTPFIKKRLGGRGGYRVFYLLIINKEKVCLGFVHPKTGSQGYARISDKKTKEVYNSIIEAIKESKTLKMEAQSGVIVFNEN